MLEYKKILVFAVMLIFTALPATFGATPSAQQKKLQDEINSLKAQISSLQEQQSKNQSWINQAQAAQVKQIINQVLSDSAKRSSFLSSGQLAGYNGKHFFLKSANGLFKMEIEGRISFRYMYTHRRSPDDGDENVSGFQMRKAELTFKGHVFDPRLHYKLKLKASGDQVEMDDAYVSYDISDNWSVRAGQFDGVFLREYDISSKKQEAVERSTVTRYFTDHSTQGLMTTYTAKKWRVYGMFTDGPDQANTDYTSNDQAYAWAVTGRGEWLVAGNWDEFEGFPTWSDQPTGVLLGAAVNYDKGASETGVFHPNLFKYSADISVKLASGVNLFTQFVGQHVSGDGTGATPDGDQLGVVSQIGAFVVPDKVDLFVRYEYADLQGAAVDNGDDTVSSINNDRINMITVGGNYYLHKQNAKFSLDLVCALDPVSDSFSSSKTGMLPDMSAGQVALRTQFQFLF